MNIRLTRTDFLSDGILGNFTDEAGKHLFATLERAYDSGNGDGSYVPKLAPGTYTCIRHLPNRLPYDTFMVEGVPDFQGQPVSGILIHILNYNGESEGCIGVGSDIRIDTRVEGIGVHMLANSKLSFTSFMNMQMDVNSFQLTVV